MTNWQIAVLGAYGLIVLAAMLRHVVVSRELRKARFLTPSSRKSGGGFPSVSVMVPACNEADNIEWCVRTLLEQDYPDFEVIVVDDRSGDETAAIIERIAREDQRLRLVRIENLPPGWTGKTYALHVAQQHARGEWFLFVDADTLHHPSCLSVMMRDCLDHQADMLSLLPALECRSFWESVIQPVAATCLMGLYPLSQVNDPRRRDRGFANGQFILVHREVYAAIGGHEAVRDKLVEDIHLGRLVREGGLRLRVVLGADMASARMYSSLDQIVQGWSRIFYAAADCRPARLYGLLAVLCVFSVLPCLMIVGNGLALLAGATSPLVKTLFGFGLVHEVLQLGLYWRTFSLSRCRKRYLVFRWLSVFAMLAILRDALRLCRTHEVTWRGTTYGKPAAAAAPAPHLTAAASPGPPRELAQP